MTARNRPPPIRVARAGCRSTRYGSPGSSCRARSGWWSSPRRRPAIPGDRDGRPRQGAGACPTPDAGRLDAFRAPCLARPGHSLQHSGQGSRPVDRMDSRGRGRPRRAEHRGRRQCPSPDALPRAGRFRRSRLDVADALDAHVPASAGRMFRRRPRGEYPGGPCWRLACRSSGRGGCAGTRAAERVGSGGIAAQDRAARLSITGSGAAKECPSARRAATYNPAAMEP